MHTVGVLNPLDARTAGVIDEIGKQIKAIPQHRIFVPDIDVLGRAALLSGILCRLQGYGKMASCARFRTVCCSYRRRSSAWWC